MIKFLIAIVLIGAGITACSSYKISSAQYELVNIDSTLTSSTVVEELIKPYRDSLSAEMDEVIGFAKGDFIKARPQGALGNLVVDLSLAYVKTANLGIKKALPIITVMNHGGLRNPISAGDITKADVFKLMPFDNTLVLVEVENGRLQEIINYLRKSGGEPINNLVITPESFKFNKASLGEKPSTNFYILTTDYLANGGDKMSFMLNPISKIETNVLLRNVLINSIKSKGEIDPSNYLDQRITLRDE